MQHEPIQALTSAIVACGTALVREATRLFKPYGITVPQFDVLELLVSAPDGLRPSVLAASLIVDPSSTTYLVDQMQKRGWVCRTDEPDDRRAYRVRVTESGKNLHREASKGYRAALSNLHKRILRDEFGDVTQLLLMLPEAAAAATDEVAAERIGRSEEIKPSGRGKRRQRSSLR